MLLILSSFVFAAIAPESDWSSSVLLLMESATLVAAAWTAGMARSDSKLSVALLALATASAVALLFFGGDALVAAVGLLSGVLAVATIVAIAVGVIDQSEVNAQSVGGAICIYLLLGLVFMFVYGAIAVLGSAPFFTQGTDGTRAIRLYFSYVTQATVGYGDYTAAGQVGRTVAIVEALVGQLYLVTVVAVLVSRMRPRRSVD